MISCAELARWCDDADPYVSRDERALACAERHLADCTTCRDRFGVELRFWAALAAPESAPVSLTPTYRPPSRALASDDDAGAANPNQNPMRLLRVAAFTIVGAVIAVYVLFSDVRLIGGRPSVDQQSSRESADRTITSASPTPTPTPTPTPSTSPTTTPAADRAAPEVDPRFRPQFVTRAATGTPPAVSSDLRPAILTVRSANAPPAPTFAQSFSVEQRTPNSTSLLTFESAARTLALRAP